eukprot:NODE_360_length_1735_cov_235.388493_g292_i0.p1 GENE.NODE_360_length_1735_cov_235.388493_g292_i0~~NODE_360_length_1735_cov_235.388493_g292_i0.p1  ORF type:complete len:543 (-),score=97.12 NODE_360_length_1735_cov_235.388493_g292_i0:105-1547(-)
MKSENFHDGCAAADRLLGFLEWTLADPTALSIAQTAHYISLGKYGTDSIQKVLYTITCDGNELRHPDVVEQHFELNKTALLVAGIVFAVVFSLLTVAFIMKMSRDRRALRKVVSDVRRAERRMMMEHHLSLKLIRSIFPRAVGEELLTKHNEKIAKTDQSTQSGESVTSSNKSGTGLFVGAPRIVHSYPQSCVVFTDLVSFTSKSATVAPEELVAVLDTLFTRMDYICSQCGLQKIKTVGDAYVAFLPYEAEQPGPRVQIAAEPDAEINGPKASKTKYKMPNHEQSMSMGTIASDPDAEETIKFASPEESVGACLHFANLVHKCVAEQKIGGQRLSIRAGISYGPVVAGVIGLLRVAYDIWGDTVNLASRMESTSVEGATQVTPVVYHMLKNHYHFTPRKSVEIKGKGVMETYLHTVEQQDQPTEFSGLNSPAGMSPKGGGANRFVLPTIERPSIDDGEYLLPASEESPARTPLLIDDMK